MQANMPATEVPTTGLTDSDADRRLSLLSSLLENLDEVGQSNASPRFKVEATFQNRLVQVRLGVASSLFLALRAKHPPTAAHGLRGGTGLFLLGGRAGHERPAARRTGGGGPVA